MDVITSCIALIALAEMGDKTQLLALVLATRFRAPGAIMAGIFVATVVNHLIAASVGSWTIQAIPNNYLRFILAGTFFLFAAWVLIPDEEDEDVDKDLGWGPFLTAAVTFFLAEMGDKTQLTTVALAAKFDDVMAVTIGTTIGMMLADGLAVMLGKDLVRFISMKWIRIIAALFFVGFGISALFV